VLQPRRGVNRLLLSRLFGIGLLALSCTPSASAGPLVFHRPIVRVGANKSNNWSGFNQGTLERGNVQFHSVDGSWTVPTATQHKAGEAEFSASWVGIGGGCIDAGCTLTDSTLIQAGTSQDVDASGAANYSAWWEIIPAPSTPINGFAVHAGDRIHINIGETTPEMWTITVQNLSTGQNFVQKTPYASTYATAEWIEETPVVLDSSGAVTIGPLPSLSRVGFDLSQTNGHPAGLTASEEMQLVDANGAPLATPSAPDSDGDGFSVCTFAGSCAPPATS
jgi:peptidase A4-like protein